MAEDEKTSASRRTKARTRIKETAEAFRKTLVQALTTAFGLVIALVWNNVVQGGFAAAGIGLTVGQTNLAGWLYYVASAVGITISCVVMLLLLSRWAPKT